MTQTQAVVRIDRGLHQQAKVAAVKAGISLQAWLDRAIAEQLKKENK